MPYRWLASFAGFLMTLVVVSAACAQSPPGKEGSPSTNTAAAQLPPGKIGNDLELVERLITVRKDYQKTLEQLRLVYLQAGDIEHARQAEEELRQYHRTPKFAYRLDLDVPPPSLRGTANVPEANKLMAWAETYKDKGWGTEYTDNQRRAEILLQELLTKYPHSFKISQAAFYLGDIYESKAYKQHRRAAEYYKRCFQWDPNTTLDARLRAARIYDHQLNDRSKAIELYREVVNYEHDQKRVQEATKRLQDLGSTR